MLSCAAVQVCEVVRQGYSDAFLTAHFEVPGEMFNLAMQVRNCNKSAGGSHLLQNEREAQH